KNKNLFAGTSSLRRGAQLKRKYPELTFESVRGNLNTRFRKLDEADDYAALILAVAGVIRMGWKSRISQYLDDDICMYAVGQGALAVECREGDAVTLELLSALSHPPTVLAATAERAFMKTLEGGCSAPVAVHTKVCENENVVLKGGVWSLDGSEEIVGTLSVEENEDREVNSHFHEPQSKRSKLPLSTFSGIVPLQKHQEAMNKAYSLGITLAQELLKRGADKVLKEAKAASGTTT
ncbi:hypothetical protein SK128_028045, partial [Halocaridina rubra]